MVTQINDLYLLDFVSKLHDYFYKLYVNYKKINNCKTNI